MTSELPKNTNKNLWLTLLIAAMVVLLYGIYYTGQNQTASSARRQVTSPTFTAEKISPELTAGYKNADLENDLKLTSADLVYLDIELSKLEIKRPDFNDQIKFSNKLNSITRISPNDKAWLQTHWNQDPLSNQALLIIYLNSAFIDRQTAISDKMLPRYEAVDHDAGQKKTVKDYYDQTRINLNQMRNLNSESYFSIQERNDVGKAEENLKKIASLAKENQDKLEAIVPLVLAFPIN